MDREIKFRGRYDYDKTWFYGNLFHPDKLGNTHISTTLEGCYVINPTTVGQFTGLKDDYGREIYEGDILTWHDDLFPTTSFHGRVFYRDAAFWVQVEEWYMSRFCPDSDTEELLMETIKSDGVEVIGNIHDNPEMFQSNKGK